MENSISRKLWKQKIDYNAAKRRKDVDLEENIVIAICSNLSKLEEETLQEAAKMLTE